MTAAQKKWFERARLAAEMSDFSRARIGCAIVERGRVISVGWNSASKTHPLQQKYNKFRVFNSPLPELPAQLHAEISATLPLRHMDVDWSKVDVYIYRLCRERPHGMAAPCPACRKYLKDLGVKSVFYTSDDGFVHEEVDI